MMKLKISIEKARRLRGQLSSGTIIQVLLYGVGGSVP